MPPTGLPLLENVYVTILAGGSGTRLWPYSRARRPKQLLPIIGDRSLLQQTVERVLPLVPLEHILILTGPLHAGPIAEQLPGLPAENIVVEPAPRGTAPCLGLAAMRLRQTTGDDDTVMISLHADHVVTLSERFREALLAAVETARQGYITTIGVIPSRPETGYGYIERAESLPSVGDQPVYRVARFREKPPQEVAEEYAGSGRHYWNTGYFCWTLGHILDEFSRHLPAMSAQLRAMLALGADEQGAFARLWNEIRPVTIDVGIMERAERVAVNPSDIGWSDVGSWASLYDLLPRDEAGNAHLGAGQHVGLDTRSSIIYSERLVATVGLEGMVVVDAGDAVLVLPTSRAQDVSALVQEMRARGLDVYL